MTETTQGREVRTTRKPIMVKTVTNPRPVKKKTLPVNPNEGMPEIDYTLPRQWKVEGLQKALERAKTEDKWNTEKYFQKEIEIQMCYIQLERGLTA